METKFDDDGLMECPECDGVGNDLPDYPLEFMGNSFMSENRWVWEDEEQFKGYEDLDTDQQNEMMYEPDGIHDFCLKWLKDQYIDCDLCNGTGKIDWVTNIMKAA